MSLAQPASGRRSATALVGLSLLAGLALVVSLGMGEFPIGPADVVRSLAGAGGPREAFVVMELRLPRALLAFAVGAALATSGALLQGLTRNPLAAPEIVGVSAGANAAAVLVIVALPSVPVTLLPLAAFAGGIVASVVVYALAWERGSAPSRLLLVGIGVTTVSYAIVIGVISTVDELVHASQLVTYMAGSVYGKGWAELRALAPWLLLLLPLCLAGARHLDALSLGDPVARGLGVSIERARLGLLCVGTALAASAVAIAGPVGFVGLTGPHIARRLAGASHATLLPVALVTGGTMTIVADAVARTAFAPVDIPVGVVTAVVGAPYLAWLLSRGGRRGAVA